jgi:hypothetical protein
VLVVVVVRGFVVVVVEDVVVVVRGFVVVVVEDVVLVVDVEALAFDGVFKPELISKLTAPSTKTPRNIRSGAVIPLTTRLSSRFTSEPRPRLGGGRQAGQNSLKRGDESLRAVSRIELMPSSIAYPLPHGRVRIPTSDHRSYL